MLLQVQGLCDPLDAGPVIAARIRPRHRWRRVTCAGVTDDTTLEYGGVRIDLAHVHESSRAQMLREAQRWIDAGHRPPLLTVQAGGVNVSTRPDLWPADVRHYRGQGRLEWVGP